MQSKSLTLEERIELIHKKLKEDIENEIPGMDPGIGGILPFRKRKNEEKPQP